VSVPELQQLGEKYHKTSVQIVLRWDLQHEVVTIPKSVHKQRIVENAQIFDFELSDEDMAAIDTLNEGRRIGPDPYTFTF
jgi:diketogulonate reductase-like aldo/keto reductase